MPSARGVSTDDAQLVALVGKIYEAALQPEAWPELTGELCAYLHATAGWFAVGDPAKGCYPRFCASGFDSACLELLHGRYLTPETNPWLQARVAGAPGQVRTTDELIPRSELYRTDLYHQVIAPLDVEETIGVLFADEDGCRPWFMACRPRAAGPFGAVERARLQSLCPHLRRASQIERRLGTATAECTAALAALERLRTGVVLVDPECRVRFSNPAVQRLAAAGDGIVLADGELAAARPAEASALRHAIASAAHATPGDGSGGELLLSRPSGRRSLAVLVVPLEGDRLRVDGRAPSAAIFVTDPEREPKVPLDTLRRLYGLTNMESRVALAMLSADRVEDAAVALGIGRNTVRSHLARVFEKTGARRQSGLIRLLVQGLAQVRH